MELDRVKLKQLVTLFKPLKADQYLNVRDVLKNKQLKADSELIVFCLASKQLAFSKHKMAFHHIAQGYADELPYMLTFCAICNSGMILNPIVDNELLHFYVAGAYNGMFLMADRETNSYWDHVTGECLSGEYKGVQLEVLQSHQLLTTKEVLEQYPDCLYGQEKMNFFQRLFATFATRRANTKGQGFLPPQFRASMQEIDDRLPEMEMGLGVWNGKKAKFYPTKVIKGNGNCLFDNWNGKDLVVYISPTTHAPSALYIEEATGASFESDKLSLSTGDYIQGGNLYSSEGILIETDNINQVFLRWYGFVSMFNNCEIKSVNEDVV